MYAIIYVHMCWFYIFFGADNAILCINMLVIARISNKIFTHTRTPKHLGIYICSRFVNQKWL